MERMRKISTPKASWSMSARCYVYVHTYGGMPTQGVPHIRSTYGVHTEYIRVEDSHQERYQIT